MKRVFFLAALCLGAALPVVCQEAASISTSTIDAGARFEIIQTPFDRATTFRLDKFTGRIHRLGNCPKDDSTGSEKCWKEMIVVDASRGIVPNRPRFQIFIDGPLKMILLFQIETGQTWQYGIEPTDKWYPFVECLDRTNNACLWRP